MTSAAQVLSTETASRSAHEAAASGNRHGSVVQSLPAEAGEFRASWQAQFDALHRPCASSEKSTSTTSWSDGATKDAGAGDGMLEESGPAMAQQNFPYMTSRGSWDHWPRRAPSTGSQSTTPVLPEGPARPGLQTRQEAEGKQAAATTIRPVGDGAAPSRVKNVAEDPGTNNELSRGTTDRSRKAQRALPAPGLHPETPALQMIAVPIGPTAQVLVTTRDKRSGYADSDRWSKSDSVQGSSTAGGDPHVHVQADESDSSTDVSVRAFKGGETGSESETESGNPQVVGCAAPTGIGKQQIQEAGSAKVLGRAPADVRVSATLEREHDGGSSAGTAAAMSPLDSVARTSINPLHVGKGTAKPAGVFPQNAAAGNSAASRVRLNDAYGTTGEPPASRSSATEIDIAHGAAIIKPASPLDPRTSQVTLSGRDTFGALDEGSAAPQTTWIRAGAQRAEAGYLDPALGWVGVRADTEGSGLHATVLPGSDEAAQAIGSHLAGLNTYLAEHHGTEARVTLGSAEEGPQVSTQDAQQGMSQGNGQHNGRSGEQPSAAGRRQDTSPIVGSGLAAWSTTRAGGPAEQVTQGGNGSAARLLWNAMGTGVHVSVVA